MTISISEKQTFKGKQIIVHILWKYHVLIDVQEPSHITLGKCPEDEHNLIYSVVL